MNETPDTSLLDPDECCICCEPMKYMDPFGYPFCGQCDHRYELLRLGRALNWPALRNNGYAIDNDMQAYLLSMICGTDERVFALIEALGDLEEKAA